MVCECETCLEIVSACEKYQKHGCGWTDNNNTYSNDERERVVSCIKHSFDRIPLEAKKTNFQSERTQNLRGFLIPVNNVVVKDDCQFGSFLDPDISPAYQIQLLKKIEKEHQKWFQYNPNIDVVSSIPYKHRLRVKFFIGQEDEIAIYNSKRTKKEHESDNYIENNNKKNNVGVNDENSLTDKPPPKYMFGMNNKFEGQIQVDFCVSDFYVATDRINLCMKAILDLFNNTSGDLLRKVTENLHIVNFLDTLSQDDMLLSFYYKTMVDSDFDAESWKHQVSVLVIPHLQTFDIAGRITIVARMKGQSFVMSSDRNHTEPLVVEKGLFSHKLGRSVHETENIAVDSADLDIDTLGNRKIVHQSEGSFSNPNGFVTQAVNGWLEKVFKHHGINNAQLVELCSGCGNHTVGLSDYFQKVISVEIDGNLVERAKVNIEINNIKNVVAVNDDMKRIKYILKRYSNGNNEGESNESDEKQQTVVLVDPPRCGLDEKTATFIDTLGFDYLIYIACGEGLVKNFPSFTSFELVEICYADHFPYTHFLEKIALFKKKSV